MHRRGTNVIEFALTMPVFMLCLSGAIEYCFYASQVAMADMAVEEATRRGAAVDPRRGDPVATAHGAGADLLAGLSFTCEPHCQVVCALEGELPNQAIGCELDGVYSSLTHMVAVPASVRARVVRRMEWQR